MTAEAIEPSPMQPMPIELRPPLRAFQCLLPVWGARYVSQFLNISLPTWMADGNLPALAAALPTEFVILTSRNDAEQIISHPGFKRLQSLCRTTLHYVDHLITGNNYSTTITLAYTEAVRSADAAMTDTCFLFLVADYVVANGSFRTILKRMQAGRSGLLVGNFQVVEEEAVAWLRGALVRSPAILSLEPRDLMSWALWHLHPATIANIANRDLMHNNHTNRLFWRVDNDTLLGRFFLMHMIAIRPESVDFIIGASCDYSFIPEMCPSGNVEIVTDSDDYLVIEMQPRDHEAKYLRPGSQKPQVLGRVLSEWTTARHRSNATTSVVFHAGDIAPQTDVENVEFGKFVETVARHYSGPARSERGHPYWIGAMGAFKDAVGERVSDLEREILLGLPHPALWGRWGAAKRNLFKFLAFGRDSFFRLWHPRFPDIALVRKRLAPLRTTLTCQTLLVSNGPTVFTTSLADRGRKVVRLRTSALLRDGASLYRPLARRFDVALLEVDMRDLTAAADLVARIAPMMKDGGTILLSATGIRLTGNKVNVQQSVGYQAIGLLGPLAREANFDFVEANQFRRKTIGAFVRLAAFARRRPAIGRPLFGLAAAPLALLLAAANATARVQVKHLPRSAISSLLLSIVVDASRAAGSDLYRSASPEPKPAPTSSMAGGRTGLGSVGQIGRRRRSKPTKPDQTPHVEIPERDDIGRVPPLDLLLGLPPIETSAEHVRNQNK